MHDNNFNGKYMIYVYFYIDRIERKVLLSFCFQPPYYLQQAVPLRTFLYSAAGSWFGVSSRAAIAGEKRKRHLLSSLVSLLLDDNTYLLNSHHTHIYKLELELFCMKPMIAACTKQQRLQCPCFIASLLFSHCFLFFYSATTTQRV